MKSQSTIFFQRVTLILGIPSGLSLIGYGFIYIIQMPEANPDAFVPGELARPGAAWFGMFQAIFVLVFSFAFLPVSILFSIKRYRDNPSGIVLGCSLLVTGLVLEVLNGLPILGSALYPEPLTQISPDVLLYLNQTTAIRYLSFDVAGFTLLYVSLLIYAIIYWSSKRFLAYLVIASIITFSASVPFIWLGGNIAVVLLTISVTCVAPIPIYFGRMAVE